MSDLIEAPWTPEQVDALNFFQRDGLMHPFTCGNRGDAPHPQNEQNALVATETGWTCPHCDYKQGWAHRFMADRATTEYRIALHKRLFNRLAPVEEKPNG